MVKPPAAVEVVVEAVMSLLTGRIMTFQDTRRLLSGGEAFLTMLREFKLEDVTDSRLKLVEVYVDNPVFRPENVQGVSFCASKFCAWVIGVVQAARWQRGRGHIRTDLLKAEEASSLGGNAKTTAPTGISEKEELSFVQKLERRKANRKGERGE
jgi:Microtubule-binding stalk of dynein motor